MVFNQRIGSAGGASASIFAYGDQLQSTDTVYAEKDGKRISGVWDSVRDGFIISSIREYGTWTLTASNGTTTKTVDVLVDAAKEFDILLNYVPAPIYGNFIFLKGWNSGDGLPPQNIWDYPIGGGAVSITDGQYLELSAASSVYSGLRLVSFPIMKALIHIEVMVLETVGNGFRILCGTGSNNRGNQITLNGGKLNVLQGNDPTSSITTERSVPFSYNAFHTIDVGLDYANNDNRIYLDYRLIATIPNSNLSTNYAQNTWLLAQSGRVLVRSVEIFGDLGATI